MEKLLYFKMLTFATFPQRKIWAMKNLILWAEKEEETFCLNVLNTTEKRIDKIMKMKEEFMINQISQPYPFLLAILIIRYCDHHKLDACLA